ncbi:MAG TPA: amidase [Solirubrobacteraceae bacterium]|jgi:amidase
MASPQLTPQVLALSAVDQAALVRDGQLSARELVAAALQEIELRDPGLGAFVHLCPERALAEADAVGPGDPRPLCGVPIAVKDLLSATEGLPTSEGMSALDDWVADHDSAHIRRLRAAGAIIVGKTNTPELGLRPVTENARFGATRNPRAQHLSPGGSSGGSGAAVAAGMVALADGSDLGGSIRIPASCCGLVGLKPSRGRVSIGPDFGDVAAGVPVDSVLTRTVLDTATALDVIAGYEPGDHHHAPPPATSFTEATRRPPPRVHVRVALGAPLAVPVDAEPRAAARLAGELLARLGHEVQEGAPDWDDEGFPGSWEMFATGALQHLVRVVERLHGGRVDPERLEPATRGWLIDSEPVALVDYLEAAERLWAFSRRILSSWPANSVLVTPTLTRLPAPVGALRSQTGVTDDGVRFSSLVRMWGVTGQPAISLPIHETADGIPVGVQLIGPPGRDDLLLALAAQLEQSVGWPT